MYKFLSAMLIAFAISTPAQADIFGIFSSNVGPEQVVEGHAYAPTQSAVVDGSMHGYPFYSGCCEQKSSCSTGLWDGFCSSKGCGTKSCRSRCQGRGLHGHAKGGCGYTDACGCGGKSSWGHLSYRGLGRKGGCGVGNPCGSKGCDTCDPCGPKHHCRLGLFDWLHFGQGHGCSVCGDVGCSSCAGGKGGFSKGGYIEHAPVQGYDKAYYGAPTEAIDNPTPQPPEVIVAPTSISDRSAWRRPGFANPFAQPLSY
ncbi:MAG: hypothetical protein H8E66_19430 [Planctomycetes bacterium]|nr:hypothetical protein [Planctomycetota bacterium]